VEDIGSQNDRFSLGSLAMALSEDQQHEHNPAPRPGRTDNEAEMTFHSRIQDTAVFLRRESEARGYSRSFDVVFKAARGATMVREDGREYIDFLAGCASLNYGHNDPDMKAALIEHLLQDGLAQGLDLFTTSKRAFLKAFECLILGPRQLDYKIQFVGPTGTNAVEAAMKLARKVTKRTNIISFTNGYHGVSLGALAATGNKKNRMGPEQPLAGVQRAAFDGYFGEGVDTAMMLDKMLSDPSSGVDAPAAILLECVQGEGGLNAASAEWVQAIAAVAKRHGALLIVDEIQTGCGRTGTFFSFEALGVVPDLVTLSKSISGFGLPMALLLVKPEYDIWKPAEHNGTFRGNNHAFVTARVALEKFWSDDSFQKSIAARAEIVTRRLGEIAALIPGAKLKGRGMMQGVDVGTGELAELICTRCFASGLIVETSGAYHQVIKILAPLTIPTAMLERGLDIIEASVKAATRSETLAA
jgi:diaminobutyrate-2-oxoglutarate transaminase